MEKTENGNANGNGHGNAVARLNNSQRKALQESIKAHYERVIANAKNTNEHAREVAVQEVQKKLGYHVLKKRIQQLEEQKEDLKGQIVRLGFDEDGNLKTTWDAKTGQYLPVESDARKLIEGKVGDTVQHLEVERDKKVRDIWLAGTIEEAKAIVNF